MTYIKHDQVPKVIRDVLAAIMAHPEFEEFMIDPAAVDWKDPQYNGIGYGHPWWKEKYLCLLDNPVVYIQREKVFNDAIAACKTEDEADSVPDVVDTATHELRELVGRINRYLMWWLGDGERVGDDEFTNLERVAAFSKEYPGFALLPHRELKEGEPWYAYWDELSPIVRTPRGLITCNSDVLHNEIHLVNTDWSV